MRLVGESNSATVPLSRTRTLAKKNNEVVRSPSAQTWPHSPTLPFWVLLRPRSDMPTLPLQPAHPAQPLRRMCALARLAILAAPFALLADEAVSGIKHQVPIHLCGPGLRKPSLMRLSPGQGHRTVRGGATGLSAGPCVLPSALCPLTKAHGGKPGCSEP